MVLQSHRRGGKFIRAWSGLSREGYLMHFPGDLITMMLETSWSAVSRIRFLFHFRKSPQECQFFYDATSLQPMIEFLSCIHLHSEGEDLNEISKTKSIRMVPTLCGMSSTDKYCSSSRDVRKPRIIQPSSRTSWPSIKPIVQGRGSEDCAQTDGRSEHTVVKQETWLLPQIPPGFI